MDPSMSATSALTTAHQSFVHKEFNWLLLHYSNNNYDDLALYSYGRDGLEELKTKIYDLNQVFVAFYREETDIDPGYILINYIPPSISGVRRARALVHSRRVGAVFKEHQTMLTVDNLSQLTSSMIHTALVAPGSFSSKPMGNSVSQSVGSSSLTIPNPKKMSKPITMDVVRRSFSETYAPHVNVPRTIPPMPPMPSILGNLLKRKKKEEGNVDEFDNLPPPTPPKDLTRSTLYRSSRHQQESDLPPVPYTSNGSRRHSMSEFAIISRSQSTDEIVIQPMAEPPPPNKFQSYSLPRLQSKWNKHLDLSADPQERARRRLAARREREEREQEALMEEATRQTELKRRKEELLKQEQQDEFHRRKEFENELQRIAMERRRKEQMEKEEEERSHKEMVEHKQAERRKRHEEHERLERWRNGQVKAREEETRRANQIRRQEEEERRRKILVAEEVVQQNSMKDSIANGWITIQFYDTLFWKRRYYKFIGNSLYFYRGPKDDAVPLEDVDLPGNLKAIKEWNEGYEELESIPFSFVIEFNDERRAWSLFADSDEDKYKVLGLLHLKAGL